MNDTQLNNLVSQLYPTGKAFNVSNESTFYKLHQALNDSFLDVVNDGLSLFDSIFPDSDLFTPSDASLWEYHLGLSVDNNLGLDLRKEGILRKMTHPNNIKARQDRLFIESQLRLAGYDVYVHENTPPYKSPDELSVITIENIQFGGSSQYGPDIQFGGGGFKSIANSSNNNENYLVGGINNLWATFFIGGAVLGEYVNINPALVNDFRELVLKLKPAHTVAYLFITNDDLELEGILEYEL